ncbi:hypothetical protein [Rhodobacter ferrooxidans]|uniref:Lipoprotein n=1 Tax=Rhodobacter ferrooxidans TaxID=371731 RepID=C8S3C9_9RHOB|nr:hypothetical protein [Rhodobacter sp. SW2]EEW24494.1 conserved hypothetical protein [Rhodobacter sp. SW2]
MRGTLPLLLALLVACSPTDMADKVGRRAAETVVLPVVGKYLPGPQAEVATRCVVDNASAAEVQALARDIAVQAGTSTVQTVLAIAARPETARCFAGAGLPPRLP